MSESRRLIYRIRRKKERLREHLKQANFTGMYYKGYRITLVDIPHEEMPATVAEVKALIDGIDEEKKWLKTTK